MVNITAIRQMFTKEIGEFLSFKRKDFVVHSALCNLAHVSKYQGSRCELLGVLSHRKNKVPPDCHTVDEENLFPTRESCSRKRQ